MASASRTQRSPSDEIWQVMLDWRGTLQAERKGVEARIQEVARQNREREELSKSLEAEKLLVVLERNLSEVALKDLECDWVETGAAHETQRELEERLRKAQKECAGRSWECLSRTSAAKLARFKGRCSLPPALAPFPVMGWSILKVRGGPQWRKVSCGQRLN